jgi:hypothetical protein
VDENARDKITNYKCPAVVRFRPLRCDKIYESSINGRESDLTIDGIVSKITICYILGGQVGRLVGQQGVPWFAGLRCQTIVAGDCRLDRIMPLPNGTTFKLLLVEGLPLCVRYAGKRLPSPPEGRWCHS